MGRVTVVVALGSNLGDREGHLQFARTRLALILSRLRLSTVHETSPVGVTSPQPDFLNQVAAGRSARSPRELLESLLAIERERGRERPFKGAPRTLDLDLILVGDYTISAPGLVLPHPRFRERRFVLEPLVAIAPDLVDPVSRRTMRDLLDDLDARAPRVSGA